MTIEEIKKEIEGLPAADRRTLGGWLDDQLFEQSVAEGIEEVERGELIPHDEVRARFAKYLNAD